MTVYLFFLRGGESGDRNWTEWLRKVQIILCISKSFTKGHRLLVAIDNFPRQIARHQIGRNSRQKGGIPYFHNHFNSDMFFFPFLRFFFGKGHFNFGQTAYEFFKFFFVGFNGTRPQKNPKKMRALLINGLWNAKKAKNRKQKEKKNSTILEFHFSTLLRISRAQISKMEIGISLCKGPTNASATCPIRKEGCVNPSHNS